MLNIGARSAVSILECLSQGKTSHQDRKMDLKCPKKSPDTEEQVNAIIFPNGELWHESQGTYTQEEALAEFHRQVRAKRLSNSR